MNRVGGVSSRCLRSLWPWILSTVAIHYFVPMPASIKILAGWDHNCVFETGQTAIKCFGSNTNGQLGLGDTNNRGDDVGEMGSDLPSVTTGADFVIDEVSLGHQHSCAISHAHGLKSWGSNFHYQLGSATNTEYLGANLPVVEFSATFLPFKVAAGESHSCVLSTDSLLVCFGHNDQGQCGAGTGPSNNHIIGPPKNIPMIDLGANFTTMQVSAFGDHVCALSQQQTLKCFGDNFYGQLGYGDSKDRGQIRESMGDGLPVIDLGRNFTPKAVATGYSHTCVLSEQKTLKCFGGNLYGQCGQGLDSAIGDDPNEMGDNLPVIDLGQGSVPVQMALGAYHTCILSEGGQVMCFGYSNYGQLGLGHTLDTNEMGYNLTPVDLGTEFVASQITAGYRHTCAISTVDTIKCWGYNNDGQLGLGHTESIGDEPNEMGDNLPFVDVCLHCAEAPTIATSAPTTTTPTTSKQPTVSPSTAAPTTTTASPSTEPTPVPTTEPTTKQPSTFSPTTVSPSATMASTREPSTSSSTPPPVTVSTAAQTTTAIWTSTVGETTASSAATSSTPTQTSETTVIIAACTSALFIDVVCICAAAFYYVRKNYVRVDRRLTENVAKAQVDEEEQQARNEIDNDADVRVPLGVVAYARENAHVEDTRGEDNLSLPAHESVLSVGARRRENIELAIAEVPGVFAHARENAHVEDTRGEDNLSLPAQESVLSVDEEGIAAHNQERRHSQQQHDGDAATLQTAVATSGATDGESLGVYELKLMVDL